MSEKTPSSPNQPRESKPGPISPAEESRRFDEILRRDYQELIKVQQSSLRGPDAETLSTVINARRK